MRLWCLHGNLQTPEVWQHIGDRWWERTWTREVKLELVDVWASEDSDFRQWAQMFCDRVRSHALVGEPQWLMGYSLGGRLAFHALLESPQLWTGGVAIAADPGIPTEDERAQCLQRDRTWGRRFVSESWEILLQEWDRQAVFAGYACGVERSEAAFDRRRICQLFDRFSKGRQADLRPALAQLTQPPLLYISGQADRKYSAIGAALARRCPTVTHAVVPAAGHRVPWENSAGFVRALQQFVRSQVS
ncbi:MAG: alpha/beta fold hydrolase [Cyanobacteria bacterium J06597_1]